MRRLAGSCALACAFAAVVAGVACHRAPAASVASAAIDPNDAAPLYAVSAMIERAQKRDPDSWPTAENDWDALSLADQATLMQAPSCADFAHFMFPNAAADDQTKLHSDGVIVVKEGRIVWEHYDGPYVGHPERRHCMWSASKSFTTGMFGAIAARSARAKNGEELEGGKLTPAGDAIGLATRLSDLIDVAKLDADPRLAAMTIEDLLSMNIPDPAWNEGYDGNIATSSVVKMLWDDGPRDMARFAANALIGAAPKAPATSTTAFRYSSGAAVILMRALQEIYGDDYAELPWTVLFDRLGMSSAVLERDQRGVFVGSSYAHMTLRDMARFGYAYLNGGYFAGEQVIDPTFVAKARVLGLGMRSPGTTDDMITEEGSFYSTGFWINPNPLLLTEKTFGPNFPQTKDNGLLPGSKFFPNSPVDVFFAAGHYGQNILIFPKDDLLVVRMAHDVEYFSKLDGMMSKARACFLSANTNGGS